MSQKYYTAFGAFFAMAADGKDPERQTQIMRALKNSFGKMKIEGQTLSLDWFRTSTNREAISRLLPSDLREEILDAYDAVGKGQIMHKSSRPQVVIDAKFSQQARQSSQMLVPVR